MYNMYSEVSEAKTVEPGIYEHYSGTRYEVLGEALFSEDPSQKFVVYKSLSPSQLSTNNTPLPVGTLWIRPSTMFTETITTSEGLFIKRFKKIS